MANPATPLQALNTAPVGTTWANGNLRIKKTTNSSGQVVYQQQNGKTTYFVSQTAAANFMNSNNITASTTNPNFTVKKAPPPAKKKTPPAAKGAPKKKVETPKKPDEAELDKPFDTSDIALAETVQSGFDQVGFPEFEDWRVRLSLAPGADYFYAGDNPGILQPLSVTNGVVFPYTPAIQVNYVASYNPVELTHSNYKVFQYSNSSVEQVTITCDFTAQDSYEARYLLAVIHFFRTMTKMFYGQDQYPIRGTPPPLCYISGLGAYQFAAHPLVINQFNYNLPNDVDYIQTIAPIFETADPLDKIMNTNPANNIKQDRLGTQCTVGGTPPPPKFTNLARSATTYVPTKISLSIGCYPVMSRNLVSNYFSLNGYASGSEVNGTLKQGGGFW